MTNELCKVLLQSGLTEEVIDSCEYKLRTFGSPYKEIEEDKISPGQAVYVNPYHHYYKVLQPLLEMEDFLDTSEGKRLFHQLVKSIFEIDRYAGVDKNTVKKQLIKKKLLEGCYGEHISSFLKELTISQQNGTIDNLLMLYQNREEAYSFIYEIQLIFPDSVIFREYKEKNKLYVYLATEKQKSAIKRYQAVEDMFLPRDITVHLTWNQPFVLTDTNEIEAWGNCMI